MEEYIGLDLSLKEIAISIANGFGGVRANPIQTALQPLIQQHAPCADRVVFETDPLPRDFIIP